MASQQAAERWLARAAATPRSPSGSRGSRGSALDDRTPRSLYASEVRCAAAQALRLKWEHATLRRAAPRAPSPCANAAALQSQRDENVAPGGARAAPSRYGADSGAMPQRSDGGSPERFFSQGNERLYEAYSQLHTMAQDFDKPFDSPAILVVGHQTDGKSGASSLPRVAASRAARRGPPQRVAMSHASAARSAR
jgi:hypothetical protein